MKHRLQHEYAVGDRAYIKQNPNHKHGEPQNKGSHTADKVNDNDTVQVRKDALTGRAAGCSSTKGESMRMTLISS